jgi:hypothetical protein
MRLGVKEMDFVTAWKASSIVLTGAFGIIGLLTEFRDKRTRKIAPWGYLSLSGILVSTVLGATAQLKESTDDAKKALAVAKQSDETLMSIRRALFPLDDPEISADFLVDCRVDEHTMKFCRDRYQANRPGSETIPQEFRAWPSGQPAGVVLYIDFYAKGATLDRRHSWGQIGDWSMEASASPYVNNPHLLTDPVDRGDPTVRVVEQPGTQVRSNQQFVSLLDIPGSTVSITVFGDEGRYLKLRDFSISFKNGQMLECSGPFTRKDDVGETRYLYTFPVQKKNQS